MLKTKWDHRTLTTIQPEVHSRRRYYVVFEGTKPGVYYEWEDVIAQMKKFPCAMQSKFPSKTEAEEAFNDYQQRQAEPKTKRQPKTVDDLPPWDLD
ncbi:hypothetical protein GTH32_19005 [Alteromonas sp. 345S023]|uniref:Ribonuclease H1 N-terminal domain-containing protein n=1 Tax=Alteromonas profundi TaxID=2696062 RepID=A0A7X5RN62_9ALTE|nr:RNase H1/viroplasmin domain-containing protein [Alteromonas profundi]NDV93255.1 hypothetical protein [Alteromonas profundi]